MELHDILLSSKFASKNNENAEGVDLSSYYTKSQTDDLISAKVDKVPDMGLSESSFTNTEKTKLAGLENYNDTQIRTEMAEIAEQAAFNRSTLGYQRKNLLKNVATSKTVSGVTFTVNPDGSVIVNGTSTAIIWYDLNIKIVVPLGRSFKLTGCPTGPDASAQERHIMYATNGTGTRWNDYGEGVVFTPTMSPLTVAIRLPKDYTVDNLTFYPMLRYAEIVDDTYEPYQPSVEEYISALEERIAALEEGKK